MDTSGIIPVVDFSTCSIKGNVSEQDFSCERYEDVARRMVEAFEGIGFVYLLNHGISDDLLQEAFYRSREFFHLPVEVKTKYLASVETQHQGYFGLGNEAFDPSVPGDMKETFDFTVSTLNAPIWPVEVDQFKNVFVRLFEECARLSHRILKMLAYGLDLDDVDFFNRCHNISNMDQPYSSCMRTLYYPPVTQESLKHGQKRLSEHTDFGSITLVFQDSAGGLQVRGPGVDWIDALPIEGSVLVNIADLMQRWTADRLVSTAHRIVVPEDRKCFVARQSLAFFVQPDPETEIRCIDGSDRYDPIKAGKYLKRRIEETVALPH